jgi:hypothetical protein
VVKESEIQGATVEKTVALPVMVFLNRGSGVRIPPGLPILSFNFNKMEARRCPQVGSFWPDCSEIVVELRTP